MRNVRRWAAAALAVSVVTLSLPGNLVTVSAETGVEETDVELAETQESGAGELQETQQKENSWRYENGEVIPQAEAYATYENAWKWVDGSYRNSIGNPIPGATQKGIDVSEHQKDINWEKVKADGIDFAIIRCGYGSDYTSQDDKYWARNVSECERLGIPYGVYIYSYAKTVEEASSEASHVLRLLKGRSLEYPVYFDMEDSSTVGVGNAVLAQMAKAFCDKISNAGYDVGIYANLHWWTTYLTDPVFSDGSWSKWVAQYNTTCDYNGSYDIWQCTSSGKVDGISGGVDVNFVIDPLGAGTVGKTRFTDVSRSSWCYEAVEYVAENGLMTGMGDGSFKPSDTTSRGQFITILYRIAGEPQVTYEAKYSDVENNKFYTNAVLWAASKGIVTGYESGHFGPGDEITREQMVSILYRYAKANGMDITASGSLAGYPDGSQVSGFAKAPMQWAIGNKLITGNGNGTLAPVSPADRAACATMIMRFMNWSGQ